jgi:branched-chain amino acid transport system substrate-binding protein
MEKSNTTLLAVVLIVGLIVGAGGTYLLVPPKTEIITETITVEKHPLDGKTVKIGCIAPNGLEPKQTFFQQVIEKDINEYVEDLGLDVTFEFVFKDALGIEPNHLLMVEELAAEGITIFIGGSWSGMAGASLGYVNDNDMLMVSDSATYEDLEIVGDNLFRYSPVDAKAAEALGDILTSMGIEYVHLAYDESVDWAEPYYQAFKTKFEANGGQIIEMTLDNDAAEVAVSEAIAMHGAENVGAVGLVWVPGYAINQIEALPGLSSILWFGVLEEQGRDWEIIDEIGGFQNQLRFLTPERSGEFSAKWSSFSEKFSTAVGYTPSYYNGACYDAAWCLALTILETGSTDAMTVKEMLPEVSSRYDGVTGNCGLNEAGDREPGIYDIWGYANVDGEDTSIKYGEYNAYSDSTTWNYQELALDVSTQGKSMAFIEVGNPEVVTWEETPLSNGNSRVEIILDFPWSYEGELVGTTRQYAYGIIEYEEGKDPVAILSGYGIYEASGELSGTLTYTAGNRWNMVTQEIWDFFMVVEGGTGDFAGIQGIGGNEYPNFMLYLNFNPWD